MRKPNIARLLGAAAMLICASSASAATQYTFDFTTTSALIGGPGMGSGTITTDGITFDSRGFTAQTITGITGTFSGSAITGLASPFGADNLYYVSGPSFVDGSGLGFITAAGTSVNLFFQDTAGSYRINTISPFTSSFVRATSATVAAVPEPASWALMLLGFGLAGAALRQTRQRAPAMYVA